jgi:hypothetical protein
VRAFGYPVKSVPYEVWRAALTEEVERSPADNALAPLVALLADEADRRMPRFSCANLVAGLAGTSVVRPALGPELFAVLLGDFVRRGWLPQPAAAGEIPAFAGGS